MKPYFRKNDVGDGRAERVGGTDGQEWQIQLPEIRWLEHSGSASIHQAQFTFRGASVYLPFFFRLLSGIIFNSKSAQKESNFRIPWNPKSICWLLVSVFKSEGEVRLELL